MLYVCHVVMYIVCRVSEEAGWTFAAFSFSENIEFTIVFFALFARSVAMHVT